ncbi:AMP-binding protein [Hymenobacter sp. BT175]|uniref:AMP-binding protein n=1 Tax=Hymenobacter translucens TaxID=2886507 RepID=UPI001D0E71A6|nr:AMP-binding protein [Hymenobacter translucens]MCC2548868.1 AMP-binding protein [Hymenobacter translucens]
MTANFVESVFAVLAANPDRVLLEWPEPDAPPRVYAAADLAGQISRFRQELAARRVQPGQRILLLLPVGPDLICGLLAVQAHGAVAVLPPAGITPATLLTLVRLGKLTAILSARPLPWLAKALFRGWGVRNLTAHRLPAPAPLEPPQPVPADQPALISHSSGTTGRPKQIVRTHRVLRAQHEVLKRVFPPWPGQRDFPLFPNVLLHNLSAGVLTVLPDLPWGNLPLLDADAVAAQIAAGQVHTLTGNVFYFRRLLPALLAWPGGFPAVQAVGVGGSPVPEKLLQELQAAFAGAGIFVIYGSSEAEPIAVRRFISVPAPSPRDGYCVGPVVAGLNCRLRLKPMGEVTLANGTRREVGEITVRGAHVAAQTPDGILATGDFGYFDDAGNLWLTGRQGNTTLHQGVQHYQVEQVLQQLPGVERAAARAEPAGFAVYWEGAATAGQVSQALRAASFPAALFTGLHHRPGLPVDQRHHSKIRYDQLI